MVIVCNRFISRMIVFMLLRKRIFLEWLTFIQMIDILSQIINVFSRRT